MKQNKVQQPWDIKVNISNPTSSQYTVEITVVYTDKKLREKMKNVSHVYFSVLFKTYWFKKGIKSARVFKTDRPSKSSQEYSSHMSYTFDTTEKAALFAQGIERALDLFIMEQILEDKHYGEKLNKTIGEG